MLITEVKMMHIENTGLDNIIIDFKPLDDIMASHAFFKRESWDYERVKYDYKINSQEKNDTYHVRVQAEAIEEDVDKGDAVMKLKTPLLGKHYYPHGIEYGEEENFTKNLVERANKLLVTASEELSNHTKQFYHMNSLFFVRTSNYIKFIFNSYKTI